MRDPNSEAFIDNFVKGITKTNRLEVFRSLKMFSFGDKDQVGEV